MNKKLSNVSSQYGAPMGRGAQHSIKTWEGKVSVSRVRLNQGGYDSGCAYWGTGMPLYRVYGEGDSMKPVNDPWGVKVGEVHDDIEYFIRAYDRDDAKARVLAEYPGARFYR